MTSRDFCYWLQGYFEIKASSEPADGLSEQQAECIRRHLALVFKHEIDPSYGPPEKQAELQAVHDGKAPVPTGGQQIVNLGPRPHPAEGIVYRC